MATIADIRKQYPQYSDLSDQQLGDALYSKYYSDMPRAEFNAKIGMAKPSAPSDPYSQSWWAQATSGLNQGLANVLGTPADLANDAIGLGMKGINAVAGTNLQPSAEPFGGSAWLGHEMSQMGSIQPPTNDPNKQAARRVMQSVGAAAVPALGMENSAANIGRILLSGAAGGGTAAAANRLFPGNKTADFLGDLLGSLATASGLAHRTR